MLFSFFAFIFMNLLVSLCSLKAWKSPIHPVNTRSVSLADNQNNNIIFSEVGCDVLPRIAGTILKTLSKLACFRHHPGFPYSLGCENWKSSGLIGNVEGMSSKHCRWISSSLIKSDESKEFSQWDLLVLVKHKYDCPNLRMRISTSDRVNYCVSGDFYPRIDLLQNMSYYDRYYKFKDAWLSEISSLSTPMPGCVKIETSTFLSRLLTSPSAFNVVVNKENLEKLTERLIEEIDLWTVLIEAVDELPDLQQKDFFLRDKSLRELIVLDTKFKLAELMGPDFAPKAEEIALSIIGPDYEI